MATKRKIFVNLPVRNLQQSIAFFTRLGFTFNKQFTDDNATCMLVGEDAYVMLLSETRFRDFAKRPLADATKQTEAIVCISATSRGEVDELVGTALAAGGTPAGAQMIHGDFMYGWSFFDPDGHHWEVMWMDPKAVQPE